MAGRLRRGPPAEEKSWRFHALVDFTIDTRGARLPNTVIASRLPLQTENDEGQAKLPAPDGTALVRCGGQSKAGPAAENPSPVSQFTQILDRPEIEKVSYSSCGSNG